MRKGPYLGTLVGGPGGVVAGLCLTTFGRSFVSICVTLAVALQSRQDGSPRGDQEPRRERTWPLRGGARPLLLGSVDVR